VAVRHNPSRKPSLLFTGFEPSGDDHASAVIAELRARHPDLTMHAWGGPKMEAAGATIVEQTGKDAVMGVPGLKKIQVHRLINQRIAAVPGQHQALAFLEFARALGIDPDGIDRAPPIPASARAFALSHQPKANRAVLISPASSHPLRNWCAERYARVADWVIAETGRPVFLMGGPGAIERSLGQAIEAAMGQRCVNLIGQDSLAQSLAMIERSACLITPDSGPAHFAAALGTPVIGLYAATWSRRSGPLGSLDHCVDRYRLAAQTYLNRPAEDLRWGRRLEFPGVMDLIETAAVIARLQALLQSG